ncbi:MAG: DoxX family protein [Tannerellaceae bacterium]|nr:DoxX family protein [Tannerellaceae bacterium]
MTSLIRILFPLKPNDTSFSIFLLVFRIFFGILLMTHGIQKLTNFEVMSAGFPDPLGVGSKISLSLAIFGELICSIGFIFGAFYRLALLPMIFTMIIAYFVIHKDDPFNVKEIPFVYLVVYLIMLLAGPGKFALNRLIAEAFFKRQTNKESSY